MSTTTQTVTVLVNLGEGAWDDEIYAQTNDLYATLQASPAQSVSEARTQTLPAGAKGDPITLGAIALGLSVAAVPGVVKIIENWLAQRHLNTITVKVKLGEDEIEFPAPASATADELESLTQRFVTLLKKQAKTNN